MNITYCPIRYDGTEPCMGKPCAWAVQDVKSKFWVCGAIANGTTISGRFMLNPIAGGSRTAQGQTGGAS